MLYEKPMWVWKIAQYKSILVDLNNGIMISGNGHDMGPLKRRKHYWRKSMCFLRLVLKRGLPDQTSSVLGSQIQHSSAIWTRACRAFWLWMDLIKQSALILTYPEHHISNDEVINPVSTFSRSFMAITRSHLSGDACHKMCLLRDFKEAIWRPEFQDLEQKVSFSVLRFVV